MELWHIAIIQLPIVFPIVTYLVYTDKITINIGYVIIFTSTVIFLIGLYFSHIEFLKNMDDFKELIRRNSK